MIDSHCHILPHIDDGARDINESIEMARIAYADGIHKIVATPHIRDNCYPPEEIAKRVEELKAQFVLSGIPIELYPAAEVSIVLDLFLFKKFTINSSDYILIELPHDHFPPFTDQLLSWICSEGLKPIIAHPERNFGVIRNPGAFIKLLNPGIYVQVTAGSLVGDFGPDVQLCAELFLNSDKIDIIASDAHSKRGRMPVLSQAVEIIARSTSRQNAFRLVDSNPAAVLAGEEIHTDNH